MILTDEQTTALETVIANPGRIIGVAAVAGAGKTSLLTAIDKAIAPKTGLYIAYNKAIAKEASRKFTRNVQCMTTHSLAYGNTVKAFKLKVGTFTYRNITEKMPYDMKLSVVETIDLFCLSSFISIDAYLDTTKLPKTIRSMTKHYLDLMQSGAIECTHSFYLKLYHILLANSTIEHQEFDLLMLDEAGDLNPVTLEIFKLLPARHKIMVGDIDQNIYSFNSTINGFTSVDDLILLPMTQSFRVSTHIAERIQAFGQRELRDSFIFRGTTYDDMSLHSFAYISRTNGALISRMIDLDSTGTPYNLVRPPLQIFKLLLTVIGLKPKAFVSPEYRHLQDATDEFASDRGLQHHFNHSLFKFLLDKFPDDVNLKSTINTIVKHSPRAIMSAYKSAQSHVGTHHPITLCTAHSSKGLEFDSVTLADDFATPMMKISAIDRNARENEEQEEARLYYVAISRCRKQLLNADYLDSPGGLL